MIDNLAVSVLTTGARAWVPTFLINASRVLRTVCANDALWPTLWRAANIIRLTGTYRVIVHHAAITVRSAGGWLARITRQRGYWNETRGNLRTANQKWGRNCKIL